MSKLLQEESFAGTVSQRKFNFSQTFICWPTCSQRGWNFWDFQRDDEMLFCCSFQRLQDSFQNRIETPERGSTWQTTRANTQLSSRDSSQDSILQIKKESLKAHVDLKPHVGFKSRTRSEKYFAVRYLLTLSAALPGIVPNCHRPKLPTQMKQLNVRLAKLFFTQFRCKLFGAKSMLACGEAFFKFLAGRRNTQSKCLQLNFLGKKSRMKRRYEVVRG